MFTVSINELELLDTGLPHRTPEFNCPCEDAYVFICPGVEAARNDLLGMIFEIMKDRDMRITRDLRPLLTDLLKRPQILSWELIVRTIIIWTQQYATHRVKRNRASDVGVFRNEVDQVARFRL